MTNQSSDKPRVRLGYGGSGRLTGESAHDTQSTITRLVSYLKPYWQRLIVVIMLALAGTAFRLAGPILLGKAIDNYIVPGDREGLLRIAGLTLIVFVSGGLTGVVQSVIMVTVGQRFVAQLRTRLFNHIQTLSMAYHDRHKVGDLMSRVANDTDAINQAISNGLIEFSTNILLLFGILVAMFLLNWQLAIGTLIIMPTMLYITIQITQRSRKAFRSVQRNLGTLNSIMEENIAGIRVVKAFAREADTFEQFRTANSAYRQAGIRADIITAALGPMFSTMNIFTIAITALLVG